VNTPRAKPSRLSKRGEISPATRATAAAATTTTASATWLGTRRPFLRFIDAERSAAHLEAIGLLNRVLCFTGGHVDERKSTGASRLAVVDEFY